MICPLCNTEIPAETKLIGPYKIFQSSIHGTEESGEITVCGRCFMLTSINDKLGDIITWLQSKT